MARKNTFTPVEHITVAMAIAHKWREVGKNHQLHNDSEIAAFLLQHYEKTELGLSVEGEGRCCISCNRRLPLYQCYQCSASQQPYPSTRSSRNREKVWTDAELDRKVSVKLVKLRVPQAVVELERRSSVKPLEQAPEAKVKVEVEMQEEGDNGGPTLSDEDDSQALPVQFDDAADSDYVIPSLTDQNDLDLTDSATSNQPGASKGKKRGRKPKDRTGMKYECKHCSASFKEAYRLKRHRKIHAAGYGKDRSFSCEQCRMTFRLKGSLDAHMRKHSGQQPYLCAICNAAFTQAKQTKQHVEMQHGDLISAAACFKCAQCQATFTVYKKLTTHVWRHTLERKFQCEHCPMAFFEQSSLRVHMRVHTGYKPYTCSECGLSFHQLCNLNRHTLTHSGERPYTCTLCPATYPASQQLKRHLQSHRGEKSFLCQLCGASYTESKSLKFHMRSHTGEKPYKCDMCEKEFARPSSLKVHKRTHSCDRPYVCAICGASFADNSNLHRHNRLKHSGKAKKRPGSGGGGGGGSSNNAEPFSLTQQLQYSVNSGRFKRVEIGASGSASVQALAVVEGAAEMSVDHMETLANQAQLVATPMMAYPPPMVPQYHY